MKLRKGLLIGALVFGIMMQGNVTSPNIVQAIEIPEPLKATDIGGQSVKLEWSKPKKEENQEIEYYVMRSDAENGKYEEVYRRKYDETSFTDYLAKEGTYYYKIVVSVDGQKENISKVKATAVKVASADNLFTKEEDCKAYIQSKLDAQEENFTLFFTEKKDGKWYEENDNYTVDIKVEWHARREEGHLYKYTYTVGYEMTVDEIKRVDAEIDRLLGYEFSDIVNTTSAEKTEAVYEYLANHTVKGEGETVYSVLLNHAGTSEAIAKTTQRLLSALNVESHVVNNDKGYWNIVQMADSCWYDVDIFKEIEQMERLEYNRFDYLLKVRDSDHQTDQYKNLPKPGEDWTFNKTEPKNITSYTTEEGLIITWDRVNHADGYKVQRSKERDGTYTDVISFEGQVQEERGWTTTNEILDSTAEVGETYYYRVKAYSNYKGTKDEGIYSDSYGVTYYGNIQLSINTSSFSPYLVWNGVEGATGYNVYRKETGKEEVLIATVSATSYSDKYAQANTNYAYRVQVVRETTSGSRNEYYSNSVTTYGIKDIELSTEEGLVMNLAIKSRSNSDRFRVYRYDESKREYALIGVTDKGQLEVTDSAGIELNKMYTYCVAPFIETENGRDINCKALPKNGYALQTPVLAGEKLENIPIISWTMVANATGYELFEVLDSGEEVLLAKYGCSTNKAYLMDKKGMNINVKIRAVVGEDYSSMFSNELSI